MARIEHIRLRLENWARWASERSNGSLGYPRQNVLARLASSGGRSGAVIPVDNIEAAETDVAVEALRFRQSHLHATLIGHYVQGHGVADLARRLGRAESTIRRHFEDADHAIATWLRERNTKKAVVN